MESSTALPLRRECRPRRRSYPARASVEGCLAAFSLSFRGQTLSDLKRLACFEEPIGLHWQLACAVLPEHRAMHTGFFFADVTCLLCPPCWNRNAVAPRDSGRK